MAKGVPEVLRRQALRKLWRLNPVLANLDGLNDYDEDFTLATTAIAELKTVYKVGKGMFSKAESEERMAAAEPAGAEPDDGSQPAEGAAPPPDGASAASPPDPAALEPTATADDARPERAPGPSEPTGSTAVPHDREPAVRGDARPAPPRRRQAASRRWGESSQ